MTEKDRRPLPEYGEYASESEQASAIERSGAPRPKPKPTPASPEAHPAPAASTDPRRAKPLDRVVTIFLLALSLLYLVGGIPSYLSLGDTLERMFTQLGAGDYATTTLTPVIGILTVVSQAIMWIATAWWSSVRLRRRAVSWWVPVIGGIVSLFVSSALLGVLLSSDPAFLNYVTHS